MPSSLHDPEWDLAWAGYDRSVPALPAARTAIAPRRPGNHRSRRWGLPLLVALALPIPASLPAGPGAGPDLPRDVLASLSPAERLLPPVEAAIARLAIESAGAACWAEQLRPGGNRCAAR